MSKTLLEISKTWGARRVTAIRESYANKGLRASGNFGRSLRLNVQQNNNSLLIEITGASYVEQMQFGRSKTTGGGSGILKDMIRQWIDDKGIIPKGGISKDSLAFLITRKIHREGIKVPNRFNDGKVISDALTADSIDELVAELKEVVKIDITSKYMSAWQTV